LHLDAKLQKCDFLKKTKQFRAIVSIDDLAIGSYVSLTGLFKEPIIGSLQSKMADRLRYAILKIDMTSFFLPRVVRFG